MRTVKQLFLTTGFILIAFAFTTCKHQPVYPKTTQPPDKKVEEKCDPSIVYFQNDVLPIFTSNCAKSGCHDAASAQKGVILDNYASIMNSGVVKPNNAADSDIIEVINETDPDDVMPPPPNAKLTQQQIATITNWINQGAQNTVCTISCDTSNVTYSGAVRTIVQTNCVGCHSGSSASGSIDLSTHAGLSAVAANGKLYGAINHLPGFSPMPKGTNKLSDCSIRTIKIWIDSGSPNN
jgi:uncharacterized membrane protein